MRWWQNAVFYQVFLRSFQDGNGDGIGDLKGLLSRMDYLNDGRGGGLGVDAICLAPVFSSPMDDFGNDVTNYRLIDMSYGDYTDIENVIAEAHARGIRVVLDVPLCNSSTMNPWFLQASSARDNRRHDYYLWSEARLMRRPNDWRCELSGRSAWHKNKATKEYYLGLISPQMPEYNWRNGELRDSLYTELRFWLGKGIDGYRLERCLCYVKDIDPSYRRDGVVHPVHGAPEGPNGRETPFQHALLRELRLVVEGFTGSAIARDYIPAEEADRLLVGNPGVGGIPEAAACYGAGDQVHMGIVYGVYGSLWGAEPFKENIQAWYDALPKDAWPSIALSSSETLRPYAMYRSRKGGQAGREESDARAKLVAALTLSLRGSPFLNQGEEIGLDSVKLRRKEMVDPFALAPFSRSRRRRDQSRTPMQWGPGPNAGFCRARPWLRLGPDYAQRNVEAQEAQGDSILSCYKRLLRLRRDQECLRAGSLAWLDGPAGILAYRRSLRARGLVVVLNFLDAPNEYRLEAPAKVLYSSHRPTDQGLGAGLIGLAGYEALILALDA